MTIKKRHHNLSLKLLVGRSLPEGSPWSASEERELILKERELWDTLSESERLEEQTFLTGLWSSPDNRTILIRPEWDFNTTGKIEITDSAFGIPRQSYRPYPKGLPLDEYPMFVGVVQWLWSRGFQVIDITNDVIAIAVPGARVVPEIERLYKLLVQSFPNLHITPHGSDEGVQIRALYDPVGGQASLEISGLRDDLLT